ncbi:component of the exocyst complex [Monoraphidium neglectum]|uniref:Exocyst complex component Sec8 n=1 Tax=Monoraphidium neglectum TaxID=145388 RepID=A0A0D2M138_9CHLO|nr:component of the exocyst complex [Monoraphidium neglectum]KIY97399.1 component of the exocyst complex [Monoraphidium neglectum]|eukprot:XP_013896419.1 component of the exocyst complex [Monoraphidium neglectum]
MAKSEEWEHIWKDVGDQLAAIGQDFTDPKFYALKHVVEILSSNQPQAMVEELRAHEARLMSLVDALATGYHSGFARSIQNYSRILQLFGDATQQRSGRMRFFVLMRATGRGRACANCAAADIVCVM